MNKIFAVYKPKGPTSTDILKRIRKLTGIKKVGHAGTLDPLATGVLVVGIGKEATKRLSEVVKKEKEYLATIKLGEVSTTDDEEGKKRKVSISAIPGTGAVYEVVSGFVGRTKQIPPRYSAVKVSGKEAYKLARKGEKFSLKPREVEIKKIEVLEYFWPYLKLRVVTGPGVYIRSLARDIGEKLNVGGYLSELERTRVGDFAKEKTMPLNHLPTKISVRFNRTEKIGRR